MQESTRESPFFLLYGRDARLPTEAALTKPRTCYQVDIDDFKTDLVCNLSDAWSLAQQNINQAQKKQKTHYDRKAKSRKYCVGDRVFVHMPSEVRGLGEVSPVIVSKLKCKWSYYRAYKNSIVLGAHLVCVCVCGRGGGLGEVPVVLV